MQVSSDMHTSVRLQQTLHVRDEICLGNFGIVWHSLMSLIYVINLCAEFSGVYPMIDTSEKIAFNYGKI